MRRLIALIFIALIQSGCMKTDSAIESDKEKVNAVLRNVAPRPVIRIESVREVREVKDFNDIEEVVNLVP